MIPRSIVRIIGDGGSAAAGPGAAPQHFLLESADVSIYINGEHIQCDGILITNETRRLSRSGGGGESSVNAPEHDVAAVGMAQYAALSAQHQPEHACYELFATPCRR